MKKESAISCPKNKGKRVIFLLSVLGSLLLLTFYLFYCYRYMFNSDTATRLLLASEQIRTGSLFPDGWYNTTGIMTGIWELLLIPFMSLISDWVLCRGIVVFIQNIVLIVCVIYFFRCMGKRWVFVSGLALIFFSLPLGQYEQCIYEGAYIAIIMYGLLANTLAAKLVDVESRKKYYVLLGMIIFLAGYNSMRNYVIIFLPMILSIVVYYWIKYRETFIMVLKREKIFAVLAIICFFCVITFCVYIYLSQKYPIKSVNGWAFISDVGNNLLKFLSGLISFYRASGDCPIVSLKGIQICTNFVFMVMSAFVAPVYLLVRYRMLESKFVKMFVIYAWCSNFVVVYMMIFSSASDVRYYTTVFFNNIIALVIFLDLWSEKIRRDIKIIGIIFLCFLVGVNHLSYISGTVRSAKNKYAEEEQKGTLVDFLRMNDVGYGVATYWNAYDNLCKSNGDIIVTSCLWNAETHEIYPNIKYEWGTSDHFYEAENHPGKSCVILGEGESVSNGYYELASEVKTFQQYKILIFDQNIYSYDLENID